MKKLSVLVSIVFLLTTLMACASNIPTSPPAIDTNEIATIVTVTLSSIPSATSTPIPTERPTLASTITDTPFITNGWEKYADSKYGFSFLYPTFLQACCGISAAMTGKVEEIITLGDKSQTTLGGGAPFDGFTVNVVQNSEGLTLQEYVEQEKAFQIQAGKIVLGESFTPHGSDSTVVIGGQTGIAIQGYCWDDNQRIYIPFPDNDLFLVIGVVEKSEGSFEQTINQIISTFRFAD